jgi:ribonuclease PH
MLDTAIGKLNTVRIDQIRDDDSGKQTRIWFAIEKNYTPVQVQQTNEQGDVIELRILSIN